MVGADPLRLSPPDKSRGLSPGRVGTEHGHGFFARADDAVLDVEVLEALLGAGREAGAARDEHRLRRSFAEHPAQLADLRQEEADVDRLVGRGVEAVDDDAVVDDPDPEPDHVGLETLGSLSRRAQRVFGDEEGVDQLDLGAGRLDRRPQPLEPVRGHGRHPLEGIGVNEEDAAWAPGCGRPGWRGHGRLSVTR